MTFRRAFVVDHFGWVIARGTDGGSLKSQRVEAHLLLAILEEVQALRADLAAARASDPTPANHQE
jgi:hypothetical protein